MPTKTYGHKHPASGPKKPNVGDEMTLEAFRKLVRSCVSQAIPACARAPKPTMGGSVVIPFDDWHKIEQALSGLYELSRGKDGRRK